MIARQRRHTFEEARTFVLREVSGEQSEQLLGQALHQSQLRGAA